MSGSPSWLDSIGKIFHVIPDLASPVEVQGSLREILEDPDLELYWWDWERERYVDVHGADRGGVAEPGSGKVVTLVDYESRKVGALAHDPRLLERPEFLDRFVPTMRIAMERDRLHRDLVGKLEELRASRLRMVRAADQERRRLERNLHDGAQQRLLSALLTLRRLEPLLADRPDAEPLVRSAREELEATIEELRELARGLHPPLLARRGLAAALRAAAARTELPIELELRLDQDLQPELEAAAYYVCAEAVTNAVKHAQASKVWLAVTCTNEALVVEIRDDGIGGASLERDTDATGLRGLVDRVEALDGVLVISSPPGHGTMLTATFPLERV